MLVLGCGSILVLGCGSMLVLGCGSVLVLGCEEHHVKNYPALSVCLASAAHGI